jgi:pimeloyl-ACP methyl ester carboxylesterase
LPSGNRRAMPEQLPDQSCDFLFTGVAGGLLLRPWFDRLALNLVAKWYLPLSRGWAAGVVCEGSYDRFREEIGPVAGRLGQVRSLLVEMLDQRRLRDEILAAWEEDFFAETAPPPKLLIARELARVRETNSLMAMRRAFLPIRKQLPAARWDVKSPAEVRALQADRLANPATAYAAPEANRVTESHTIPGPRGPEWWIRMKSPPAVAGDTAWARVQAPRNGPVRGVLILLHGIGLEPEMWRSLASPAASLIDQGICLISPEGPWHGRRCPAGEYGGERILARGPASFIDLFDAWVTESALWISWARERFDAPIALGGVSLGAFTAQIALSAAARWPDRSRPDAAILITTTRDIAELAFDGSLATKLSRLDRMVSVGWDREELASMEGLLRPLDSPGLPPEKIVMALGDVDTVTPYPGGRALAETWGIPAENLFVTHRGHFSASLGLCRDSGPLDRLCSILTNG